MAAHVQLHGTDLDLTSETGLIALHKKLSHVLISQPVNMAPYHDHAKVGSLIKEPKYVEQSLASVNKYIQMRPRHMPVFLFKTEMLINLNRLDDAIRTLEHVITWGHDKTVIAEAESRKQGLMNYHT